MSAGWRGPFAAIRVRERNEGGGARTKTRIINGLCDFGCPKDANSTHDARKQLKRQREYATIGPGGFSSQVTVSGGFQQVPESLTSEDRIAASRLNGLLDYVEALVKLDERVVTRLAQHKLGDGSQFILHEHELAGLPGVTLDGSDADGAVWLRMQRLQRAGAPAVGKEIAEWIEVSNDPSRSPTIRDVLHLRVVETEKNRLITAKEARAEDCIRSLKIEKADVPDKKFFDVMLRLEDRPAVVEALETYCAGPWATWAEIEKPRRRSIAVYQRLFEIAQRLCNLAATIRLNWSGA
jgi:hypothetical protein